MADDNKQLDFLQERADLIEMIDVRSTRMELDLSPIAPLLVRPGARSDIRGDVIAGVDLHTLRRIDAALQELADRREQVVELHGEMSDQAIEDEADA